MVKEASISEAVRASSLAMRSRKVSAGASCAAARQIAVVAARVVGLCVFIFGWLPGWRVGGGFIANSSHYQGLFLRFVLISEIFQWIAGSVWKFQWNQAKDPFMKRVLCLLENGFEEIETVTPVDVLRRAGAEVVLAGVSRMTVVGKSGIRIEADALLENVRGGDFDVLFLPGGPAVMELRKNEEVLELVREFSGKDKLIAAICAAPLLLLDAGVLNGRKFTAHFSTTSELPQNTGDRVVSDGAFITSRGAGTALEFGLEIVAVLAGSAVRDEVAAAIMV